MLFTTNDRHIIVITGEYEKSLAYAKNITDQLASVEIVDSKKARLLLGQEFDAVIYNMHLSFDPNAFGAITGTIKGGGFLILLKPSSPFEGSLFLQRFEKMLNEHQNVHFLSPQNENGIRLSSPPKKAFDQIYASDDQQQAVEAIIKVVTGHRRRPLLITSDRGRGKSASLGIAASILVEQGVRNIIICAPSKRTVQTVFKHANLSDEQKHLVFYAPDELHQTKPKADLVLIDEAAAIPLPLLTDFIKQHSRIVFASTQHGYEGSGRGFAINFKKSLDNVAPEWKSCELKKPIRWNENDTLEGFTFDALLLNAEVPADSVVSGISLETCQFSKINKEQLLTNNDSLKQVFGLLVSAHYQTKPSDLMQLLDDDKLSIYCLEAKKTIVAVSLVISEGSIHPELSEDIFAGKRRLQGHLVAQALSSNVGIEYAPQLSGERVSRIAVHPQLQGKGFGSQLIKNIIDQSNSDYISTCYGATQTLINFWLKAGFKPVNVGIKRDASSGSHSVMMLYGKTNEGKELSTRAETMFASNFVHLLSDSLKALENDIVLTLFPKEINHHLSETNLKIVKAFANGARGYENSIFVIWKFVCSMLVKESGLNPSEQKILVIKVIQRCSWEDTVKRMEAGVTGKRQALNLVKQAVTKLISSHER